jgi:hypothetical protein
MADELIYPYRPNVKTLALGFALFGLAAFYFVEKARTNTRGLIIDRVIELRPSEATIFYTILAALSFGFVALAVYATWVALTRETVLALRASAFSMPVGVAKRDTTIPYREIRSIQLQAVRNREYLAVVLKDGKRVSIWPTMLPSKEIFMSVRSELSARARTAQQL